jgi:hypothetical protein
VPLKRCPTPIRWSASLSGERCRSAEAFALQRKDALSLG